MTEHKQLKINEALLQAQTEMENAVKGKTNPMYKSKYISLEDLYTAVKPVLNNNGFLITHPIYEKDGKSYCGTRLIYLDGETIENILPLMPNSNKIHELGSLVTYIKRYTLAALVAIGGTDEDDDGNVAQELADKPISDDQVFEITELFGKLDSKRQEAFKKHYKLKSLTDIKAGQYQGILGTLKRAQEASNESN